MCASGVINFYQEASSVQKNTALALLVAVAVQKNMSASKVWS